MSALIGVPHHLVRRVWPMVLPLVESALRHDGGRWSAPDILRSLESRDRQLWLVEEERPDGIIVTEIAIYPRRKTCVVFLAAGRRPVDWRDRLGDIEGWARAQGCAEIELHGRKGWRRALPDWPSRTVLTKEL